PQELLRSLRRGMIIVRREWAIREELQESRALLGEQLGGMAAIMQELAADVGRDKQESDARELRINESLMRLGLEVQGIDIVSLEEGRVAIDIFTLASGGADACSKIVAPLLSDILGETIVVSCEQTTDDGQFVRVTVTSARRYDVRSGAASVARDGRLENGDSFCLIDVGRGRFAIALSDGMGNGQRANRESTVAVGLLEQLLRAGFDETVAIKTVNSVLLLRFPDEMYATLDLAVIDLYSLRTELLKVGSVSTYVKRGRKVLRLEGESIPIGMLREVEIARQQIALQERDLLVFISDGILACVGRMDDPGDWVRRQLERFDTSDPQALADLLLETAVRAGGGEIRDDMTVLCARIDRFTPRWATISRPDVPRIKTQRKPRNPAPREKRERLVQV
ncbi:MAG: SpoIIE family protein phosphatase, partial [Firmicutes bacterium]|nr:SpoIIE family protein phosphatase [Bacillota bacterium]